MRISVRWLLSPTFAAAFSTVFGLLCLLPGQDLYNQFYEVGRTHEPLVTLWIVACGFFFLAGILFIRAFPQRAYSEMHRTTYSNIPSNRLLILGIVGLLANILALYRLVSVFGISGSIDAIRGIGTTDVRLAVYHVLKTVNIGWALAFTTPVAAVLTVALVRLRQRGEQASLILLTLVTMLLVNTIVALFTQSKGSLFNVFLTVIVAVLLDRRQTLKITIRGVIIFISVIAVILCGSAILQARRGVDVAGGGAITQFAAYTVLSYNRLAYVLDGRLLLPNMFEGFWTNRWWWGLPGTDLINVALSKLQFTIPAGAFDSWLDTFGNVKNAGLNPQYIWTTIYGEAFLDYGWWGCLWFFFYGALSQFLFRRLQFGSLSVHGLYAWVAMSNLQWFSGATATTRGLLFGVLIMLYLGVQIRGRRLQIVRPART